MSTANHHQRAGKGTRYQVWIEQANFDLQAARASAEDGFHEWACFQAEQSLEKALKAVLVHGGMRAPKIHKLGVILGMCNDLNPDFSQIKIDYRFIEAYTFVSRYPFLLPGVNKSPHEFIQYKDAQDCIQIADQALQSITEFVGRTSGSRMSLPEPIKHFTAEQVEERIQKFIQQVTEVMNVEKIILFGGFARHRAQQRDKTMDVLIIAHTDLDFFSRIRHVKELTKGGDPLIEPLVYTPDEFHHLLEDEGEGFLEGAIEEGIEIYKKTPVVG